MRRRTRPDRLGQRPGVLPRDREVRGLHGDEVEHHVQLVAGAATEVPALLPPGQVHLAQQDRVAAASAQEGAEVLQVLVRVAGDVVAGGLHVLHQEGHGVDAEAVQTQLQPQPDGLGDLVADGGVGEVQVRLVGVEVVQVPLAGAVVLGPDAVLLVGEHHLVRGVGRRGRAPDVVVAVPVGRAAPGRLEPGVPVRGVVDDQVRDHPDAAVMGGPEELDEVGHRAEARVDPEQVGHVVPVVTVGCRVERHQPQAGDAELGEVVDAAGQSGEVADPVTVGVLVGLDVDAVDDRLLPPQVARVGLTTHRVSSVSIGRTSSKRVTGTANRAAAALHHTREVRHLPFTSCR